MEDMMHFASDTYNAAKSLPVVEKGFANIKHLSADLQAYSGGMPLIAAEVIDTAKSLPREERAEIVRELLGTLGNSDLTQRDRTDALRAAIDTGIASLEANAGTNVAAGELADYLRSLGRTAPDLTNV